MITSTDGQARFTSCSALEPRSHHQPYLEICRAGAEQVEAVFRDAIAAGDLEEADLFDRDYQSVPDTDPVRYHSRFDTFTDSALPPVQNSLVKMQPGVVFACAVDDNGYVPTHNVAEPLTGDPDTDLVANRSKRIDKRKEDGTLFEEEFKKPEESEDERLAREVEEQKRKDEERLKERLPNCPQCGQKMELIPEQGIIACQPCGVGMRI